MVDGAHFVCAHVRDVLRSHDLSGFCAHRLSRPIASLPGAPPRHSVRRRLHLQNVVFAAHGRGRRDGGRRRRRHTHYAPANRQSRNKTAEKQQLNPHTHTHTHTLHLVRFCSVDRRAKANAIFAYWRLSSGCGGSNDGGAGRYSEHAVTAAGATKHFSSTDRQLLCRRRYERRASTVLMGMGFGDGHGRRLRTEQDEDAHVICCSNECT